MYFLKFITTTSPKVFVSHQQPSSVKLQTRTSVTLSITKLCYDYWSENTVPAQNLLTSVLGFTGQLNLSHINVQLLTATLSYSVYAVVSRVSRSTFSKPSDHFRNRYFVWLIRCCHGRLSQVVVIYVQQWIIIKFEVAALAKAIMIIRCWPESGYSGSWIWIKLWNEGRHEWSFSKNLLLELQSSVSLHSR